MNILHKKGFGTKNLPDAIEWHCSSFWNHALSSKEIEHSNSTKLLLETAVAVPIWLKRSEEDYSNLAKKLNL